MRNKRVLRYIYVDGIGGRLVSGRNAYRKNLTVQKASGKAGQGGDGMSYYFPVFADIIDSSIWEEPDFVIKVFLSMLAKKKRGGYVWGSVFNVSRWAKKSEAETMEALRILSSPDTKRLEPQPFEGRRIQKVDGGWLIINAEYYQRKMKEANDRVSNAERQSRHRQKKNATVPQGTMPATPFTPPAVWKPDAVQVRLGAIFKRKPETAWSKGEMQAYREIGAVTEEDLGKLEAYYRAKLPESATDIRRRDLVTLLNNFSSEMDRARSFKPNTYL